MDKWVIVNKWRPESCCPICCTVNNTDGWLLWRGLVLVCGFNRLKIRFEQSSAGSSPALGTIEYTSCTVHGTSVTSVTVFDKNQ